MKKYLFFIALVILGIGLRFYQLGSNPESLDWDEASLGYNAYSILKTGRDEYGTFLPLAIRSFGDYKPPLYTYITIPSVMVFGLTEFAVRLPSAVFGVIALGATYWLGRELLYTISDTKKRNQLSPLPFLATVLLTISPWHLQFSRVAFEANIALTLFIAGIAAFLTGLRKKWFLGISAFFLALSLYAYHSPRLVAPVLVLLLGLWFRQTLWQKKKEVVISFLLGLFLLFPLVKVITGEGKARFNSVTVLTSAGTLDHSISYIETDRNNGMLFGRLIHNRRIIYLFAVAKGYLDHFDLSFLFLTGDGPGRHHAVDMGMLYWVEAPFLLFGILSAFGKKERFLMPVFFWFLCAPLASSVTSGTPHAVRALLYLPTYQIITAYGLLEFYFWSKQSTLYKSFPIGTVFLFFLLNFSYYLHMYYVHAPLEHAREWQFGYREAVSEVAKIEKAVDRIIVTYAYDQPYIYFLFYNQIDPSWYQKNWGSGEILRANRSFGKYEFRNIDWEQDKNLKNTLLVGLGSEIPEDAPGRVSDIYFPNGAIAFRIVHL